MLPFKPELLTVTYHKMSRVTTALGGSISIVDEEDPTGKTLIRIAIPFAVARKFIKATKFTEYMNPVTVAILRYGDSIINLERDLLSNIKDAEEGYRWISNLEVFNDGPLQKRLGDAVWFFDGRYVFHFPNGMLQQLKDGGPNVQYISQDLRFRSGVVNSIDLYEIDEYRSLNVMTEDRSVMTFVTDTGEFAVTPPIWKNVEAIGSSAATETDSKTDHEDYLDRTTGVTISADRVSNLIDNLDDKFALNLNFTMYASKVISNQFGFDSIEPLQLPEIMLSLTTVNIPSLPKSIKSTFSIGLSPSHGLAWLMGLLNRAEDMDSYLAVRAAIKYLTSKGLFHKSTVRPETLFIDNVFAVPDQVMFGNMTSL